MGLFGVSDSQLTQLHIFDVRHNTANESIVTFAIVAFGCESWFCTGASARRVGGLDSQFFCQEDYINTQGMRYNGQDPVLAEMTPTFPTRICERKVTFNIVHLSRARGSLTVWLVVVVVFVMQYCGTPIIYDSCFYNEKGLELR